MSKAVKTTCIICCLCLIVCGMATPVNAAVSDLDPADYVSGVSVNDGVKTVTYTFDGVTGLPRYWDNGSSVGGGVVSDGYYLIRDDATVFVLNYFPTGQNANAGNKLSNGRILVNDIIPGSPITLEFSIGIAYHSSADLLGVNPFTYYYSMQGSFYCYDNYGNYIQTVSGDVIKGSATAEESNVIGHVFEFSGEIPVNTYAVLPVARFDIAGLPGNQELGVAVVPNDLKMIVGINSIVEQSHQMDVIKEKLDDLNDSIGNVNDKLDDILNQPEQEKDDASQAGKDALDNIVSVVPDHTSDLVDAFSGLAASMSYDGTVARIAIPAVSMPGIDGLFEGFVIMQPQELDFEVYFDMLPEDLLLLVQSLFTAALIVFCFKELYSTIQYCLTLRG